ncbi:MAG: hypothetical protein M1274_15725 [Actinobacteria bacterium]|nr:hypothetical protein [Actinomycetota bacterium]
MTDERLSYEPAHDTTGHYVIATARTAYGPPVKADGRTHREAMEALASALIDLYEWQWEERKKWESA